MPFQVRPSNGAARRAPAARLDARVDARLDARMGARLDARRDARLEARLEARADAAGPLGGRGRKKRGSRRAGRPWIRRQRTSPMRAQ